MNVRKYDLNKIFLISSPITEKEDLTFKYLYLAFTRNLQNYRVLTIGKLLDTGIVKDVDLPENIYDFIGQEGKVLVIANIIVNKVVNLIFRSLSQKRFTGLTGGIPFPYGIGFLQGFTFGTPLCIVEGTFDRDCLREIYPYTIASLSAGLSSFQKELLLTLTNNFILAYDNDKSGLYANFRDAKFFKEKKCFVETLNLPYKIKDTGALIEMELENKEWDRDDLKYYLRTHLGILSKKDLFCS